MQQMGGGGIHTRANGQCKGVSDVMAPPITFNTFFTNSFISLVTGLELDTDLAWSDASYTLCSV